MGAFGTGKGGTSERSDDYPHVVCVLNDRWRVIECKNGVHWVLQRSKAEGKNGKAWHSVKHHLERDALIESCVRFCGPCHAAAMATLHALPSYFHLKYARQQS